MEVEYRRPLCCVTRSKVSVLHSLPHRTNRLLGSFEEFLILLRGECITEIDDKSKFIGPHIMHRSLVASWNEVLIQVWSPTGRQT
jgi:hypothetical protein